MGKLDRIDLFLLAVVAYVAVTSLVRLMRNRHSQVMNQVQGQIEQEIARKRKEE